MDRINNHRGALKSHTQNSWISNQKSIRLSPSRMLAVTIVFTVWSFVLPLGAYAFMPPISQSLDACRAFLDAKNSREQRAVCTENMSPFIEYLAIDDMTHSESDEFRYEFITLSNPPVTLNGAVVGHWLETKIEGEPSVRVEGFFHLIVEENRWKINDWYLTSINHEAIIGGSMKIMDVFTAAESQQSVVVSSSPSPPSSVSPTPSISVIREDDSQPLNGRVIRQSTQSMFQAGQLATQLSSKTMRSSIQGMLALIAFVLGALIAIGKLLKPNTKAETISGPPPSPTDTLKPPAN